MNEIFWAKTNQSYEEHITSAYKAWKETVSAKKNLIRTICKKSSF